MSNMTLNNLLRAEGSSKLSMIGMGAGSVLNMILDPVFIFVFDLGIEGAAMATALSQAVTFGILFSHYLNHHSVLRISFRYFKPEKGLYLEMSKIGIPTFCRQVLFSISLGLMNQASVNFGGQELLAATGILFKVTMVPGYVMFGIGQGFQPVAGYNYGAGNRERVIDAIRYSFRISILAAISCAVILIAFDTVILSIFKPAAKVMAYGITGIRYYSMSIVLMSVTNIITFLYQALGRGKESLMLSVSRQGIFLIPSLLILPNLFGTSGILGAQLMADVLTLIVTMVMFVPFIRSGIILDDQVSHESA